MEIFESKLSKPSKVSENITNVTNAFQRIFDTIIASRDRIPHQIRFVAHQIWCSILTRVIAGVTCRVAIKVKYPNQSPQLVGSFIFLRFLCPAIVVPASNGIMSAPPPRNLARGLVLITKVLQNMSNDMKFGAKEPAMIPLNSSITANMGRFLSFLTFISSVHSLRLFMSRSLPQAIEDPVEQKINVDKSYEIVKKEAKQCVDQLTPTLYIVNV